MRPEPGISGYPVRPIGEHGEYQMKEVSFGLPPGALRDVARFLQRAADEMDKGTGRIYWHRHISECVKDWQQRFPSIDIVVVDLATY